MFYSLKVELTNYLENDYTLNEAVGIEYFCMSSLAKVLLLSSWATGLFGPKHRMPVFIVTKLILYYHLTTYWVKNKINFFLIKFKLSKCQKHFTYRRYKKLYECVYFLNVNYKGK